MSAFACIDRITEANARESLDNESAQLRFLQSWWSRTYNRPLKDPLLLSYTLEELYYEFRDRIEREKAVEEQSQQETDKIEQAKIDDAMSWADAEEAKELQDLESNSTDSWKPSEDDKKWMEDQLKEAKEEYGEDFGEDIDEDFQDG